MDFRSHPSELADLFGGVIATAIILRAIYLGLRTGEIKRRPPSEPWTRQNTPKAFWSAMVVMVLGAVSIFYGVVVILRQ